MKRLVALLLLVAPLLMAGYPQEQQEQRVARRPRHESTVDWTTVLVAGFGCLGASVPAYFTYRSVQARRRAKREEVNGSGEDTTDA